MGARVVVSGALVVAGDGGLAGFDRLTGQWRWSFDPAIGRAPGPYLGESAGDLIFAGSADGYLHAVDVTDGSSRWTQRVQPDAIVFPPVVSEDRVFAAYAGTALPSSGGVAAFERRTGRLVWRRRHLPWEVVGFPTGSTGSPVIGADVVITGTQDGTLVALRRDTGALRWVIPRPAERADGGRPAPYDFRPVVVSGDTLLAGSLTGEVLAYDLRTRRERWRRSPVDASVAFGLTADNTLVYVPYLSGQLVALSIRDGTERWRTGGSRDGFIWTPLVSDARLFAAGSGAGFVAFIP
jgi:outer membrane protein assembly factor BamB